MVESIAPAQTTNFLNPGIWPSDEVRAQFIPQEVRINHKLSLNSIVDTLIILILGLLVRTIR